MRPVWGSIPNHRESEQVLDIRHEERHSGLPVHQSFLAHRLQSEDWIAAQSLLSLPQLPLQLLILLPLKQRLRCYFHRGHQLNRFLTVHSPLGLLCNFLCIIQLRECQQCGSFAFLVLQTFDSLSLRVHLALITSFTVFSIRGRCNHDPISSFQEIQWSGVLCLALRDSSSGSRSFSGSDVLS